MRVEGKDNDVEGELIISAVVGFDLLSLLYGDKSIFGFLEYWSDGEWKSELGKDDNDDEEDWDNTIFLLKLLLFDMPNWWRSWFLLFAFFYLCKTKTNFSWVYNI